MAGVVGSGSINCGQWLVSWGVTVMESGWCRVGSDCYGEWLVSWGVAALIVDSGWCRGE